MNKKERPKKGLAGIRPRIVRAWFDTVINPLINSLRAEGESLKIKDWTWRFRRGSLEMIKRIPEYLDASAVDNLDQLLGFYPAAKGKIDSHDKALENLCETCRSLHATIISKSDIASLYERVTSPQSLAQIGTEFNNLFASRDKSDHISLLAEYVVNNTGELPYYYTVSPLWNLHWREFLEILESPSIVAEARKTMKAGQRLLATNGVLIKNLKEMREQLSLENDVPLVSSLELSLTDSLR
jgi:hypothetical protein